MVSLVDGADLKLTVVRISSFGCVHIFEVLLDLHTLW
jgi:hypothetical protein